MANGLFDAQQMGGLMGMSPTQMAALSAGAALLQGGGPSMQPRSLGQNIGSATQAGIGAFQQGQEQALQRALMQRKLAREDQLGKAASQYFSGDPALAEIAAVDPELAARLQTGLSSGDPAAVREWQYYTSLSPQDQKRYLNMKRARQIEDIGGARTDVTVAGDEEVLSPLTDEATAARTLAQAEAEGGLVGKGLRMGESGEIEAIPGSPEALAREESRRQREAGETMTGRAAQTVFEDTDRALGILREHGRAAAGTGGAAASAFPIAELPANRLKKHIESIKGNVGIDSLLRIKASGAGLGQVPQSQLEMLAGLMGKLDVNMEPEDLRWNLERIQEIYADIVRSVGGDPNELYRERLQRLDNREENQEDPLSTLTPEQREKYGL